MTGKEWNPEVQLYYFGSRWYDPEIGRWLSSEPYKLDGPNLYQYSFNDSINGYDEDGLVAYKVFGHTIDIKGSVSWAFINSSWDLTNGEDNTSISIVFITVGSINLDFSIDPPSECQKYVSPYLGLSKMVLLVQILFMERRRHPDYKDLILVLG